MSRVEVSSFLRIGDDFLPVQDVSRYDGDLDYVPGAISLVVDGAELLGLELWDDVNWLWPFIVQALDECRRTGTGKIFFPDQPIAFQAETLRTPGSVLLTVTDGGSLQRKLVAPVVDLYEAVADAGATFFREFRRLSGSRGKSPDEREESILFSWLDEVDPEGKV